MAIGYSKDLDSGSTISGMDFLYTLFVHPDTPYLDLESFYF
jgi:hypothetical protein